MSFSSTGCIIYDIKYFNNLDRVNSLYLVFSDVDAYIEGNVENKYLVFALTDKIKESNYLEL